MIFFINVFDSFIHVITLETLKFTFSVLFGTHILPFESSRLLQFPLHLFKLTIDG